MGSPTSGAMSDHEEEGPAARAPEAAAGAGAAAAAAGAAAAAAATAAAAAAAAARVATLAIVVVTPAPGCMMTLRVGELQAMDTASPIARSVWSRALRPRPPPPSIVAGVRRATPRFAAAAAAYCASAPCVYTKKATARLVRVRVRPRARDCASNTTTRTIIASPSVTSASAHLEQPHRVLLY